MEVTNLDKERIEDDFLNDSLIDYYLRRLQDDVSTYSAETLKDAFYLFNTFFNTRYKQGKRNAQIARGLQKNEIVRERHKAAHASVSRWIRKAKVNLFEKEFLVVPINGHLHWSVAIVCNPSLLKDHFEKCLKTARWKEKGKEHVKDGLLENSVGNNEVDLVSEEPVFCILHLDSLRIHNTREIKNNLFCFLYNMWVESFDGSTEEASAVAGAAGSSSASPGRGEALKSEEVRELCVLQDLFWALPNRDYLAQKMNVPQQTNSTDCGLYTCQYIRQFAQEVHQRRKDKKSTVITLDMVQKRRNEWLGPNFFGPLSGKSDLGLQFRAELKRFVTTAEEEYNEALQDEKAKKMAAKKAKAAKAAAAEKGDGTNSDEDDDDHSRQSSKGDSEEDCGTANHDSGSATESDQESDEESGDEDDMMLSLDEEDGIGNGKSPKPTRIKPVFSSEEE